MEPGKYMYPGGGMMMKRWIGILLLLLAICCTGGCQKEEIPLSDGAGSTPSIQQPVTEKDTPEETGSSDRANVVGEEGETSPSSAGQQAGAGPVMEIEDDSPAAAASRVHLLVTRDFGSRLIFDEMVEMQPGWTVADVLHDNLQVETAYGGSFVSAINGFKSSSGNGSGPRQDWFYFVNGISSNMGMTAYRLHAGELIWWDYHAWQGGPSINAVIGAFPEPFVNGYAGHRASPVILYSPGYEQAGKSLQACLNSNGAGGVEVLSLSGADISNRTRPVIVLGGWHELKDNPALKQFNQAAARNGTFIHFTDAGLELLNYKGDAVQTRAENTGVIVASGTGLGDSAPLWLIVGTDEAGVLESISLLINRPEELKKRCGAVVTGGRVTGLPVP